MMWNFDKYSLNTAILDEQGVSLSYRQLSDFGGELADAVGGRCLVFCLCSNSIGSILGYTAFMQNNILPLLLNWQMDGGLLQTLLELYRPKYVWKPTVGGLSIRGECVYEKFGYELIRYSDRDWEINQNLGLLLTTSGSTGSPKFVRQSYENVRVNAEQIVEYLELAADERPITTLPMNYTYGLSIINSHLMIGATVLATDKSLAQKDFWKFLKNSEATSFGGVPYTYEMMDKLRFMRMDLPSLRYMTQAGGKLSPELHKKFAEYAVEKGKKFVVMYGQCEATARMAYLPAEDALRKYGYMGIPIPGGRFELIDGDGRAISEPETAGELVYYGPNVTMGYAEKPEDLALGDEQGGRLETGDMAVVDAEGYYRIVGRKKRFLKVYGNRVNLDELDGMLKKQFDRAEIVCGGVDDHVYVFVAGEGVCHETVREFLAGKTGLNQAAFNVITIEKIPRNDAGKVLFRELEKFYEI